MEAFRIEKVNTPAGEYTIKLYPDYDAPNPLEDDDNGGMGIFVTGRDIAHDSLDDVDMTATGERAHVARGAANAVRTWIKANYRTAEIEQRYRLWRAMFGGPMLVTGSGWANSDFWDWYVLVDTDATYRASDGKDYTLLPQPEQTARATMEGYQKWAQGGYCGYVVKAPGGDDLAEIGASVWGYGDDDCAVDEARSFIEYDAQKRLGAANLVGAGFVGIV